VFLPLLCEEVFFMVRRQDINLSHSSLALLAPSPAAFSEAFLDLDGYYNLAGLLSALLPLLVRALPRFLRVLGIPRSFRRSR